MFQKQFYRSIAPKAKQHRIENQVRYFIPQITYQIFPFFLLWHILSIFPRAAFLLATGALEVRGVPVPVLFSRKCGETVWKHFYSRLKSPPLPLKGKPQSLITRSQDDVSRCSSCHLNPDEQNASSQHPSPLHILWK